jgi:Polyprenyl synthetase
VGLAVNAGDALAVLALQPLRDGTPLGTRLSRQVSDEFIGMLTRTIEGQATELGWRADNVVDLQPTDFLELSTQKTCWYTTVWPLRVGALIGSAGTAPLDTCSAAPHPPSGTPWSRSWPPPGATPRETATGPAAWTPKRSWR